jgi:predicted Zn-dependent protease
LALNPHSTVIRCQHAHWRRAVAEHAWAEAVREAETAVAADPLNAFAAALCAMLLALARRYDDAVRVGEAAVALDPDAYMPRLILQFAYGWSGRHAEAVAAAHAALVRSGRGPFPLSTLAAEYGRVGDRARAEAAHRELEARAAHEFVPPGHLARSAVGAGRVDEALARCHRALDEGDPHVRTELTHGRFVDWAPLAEHPDWPALRARIAAATGEAAP